VIPALHDTRPYYYTVSIIANVINASMQAMTCFVPIANAGLKTLLPMASMSPTSHLDYGVVPPLTPSNQEHAPELVSPLTKMKTSELLGGGGGVWS